MRKYSIEIADDMVYVEELSETGKHTSFSFEKHVFERAVGVDTLLGRAPISEDENFLDLLDEYREEV